MGHGGVVTGAKGLLLRHSQFGMPNTACNAKPHAPTDTTASSADYSDYSDYSTSECSTCAHSASRSLQLRSRQVPDLGATEEGLVLHEPPRLRTADRSSRSRRPIQLRRWLLQLVGRLVGRKEGVVLPRSRQGLPQFGRRMRAEPPHRSAASI